MTKIKHTLIDVVEYSKNKCKHKIQCELAYATIYNFLGRIVDGYHADAAHIGLVTPKTAQALCLVQDELNNHHLGLFIFDSFRPLRAVRDFKKFMHEAVHSDFELQRKRIHYPHIEKKDFATLGYIADEVSQHCFGDTVDLSLIDLKSNQLIDMGACFDYFDPLSHADVTAEQIGHDAYDYRMMLSRVMQQAGFIPHPKEFWHYTYREREIVTPLDFDINQSR